MATNLEDVVKQLHKNNTETANLNRNFKQWFLTQERARLDALEKERESKSDKSDKPVQATKIGGNNGDKFNVGLFGLAGLAGKLGTFLAGIGALGFHAYLQRKNIAWESAVAKGTNMRIFKHIKTRLDTANLELGAERGEAPDAAGTGRIYVPDSDVEITQDLTVTGYIDVGSLTVDTTISSLTLTAGDIRLYLRLHLRNGFRIIIRAKYGRTCNKGICASASGYLDCFEGNSPIDL